MVEVVPTNHVLLTCKDAGKLSLLYPSTRENKHIKILLPVDEIKKAKELQNEISKEGLALLSLLEALLEKLEFLKSHMLDEYSQDGSLLEDWFRPRPAEILALILIAHADKNIELDARSLVDNISYTFSEFVSIPLLIHKAVITALLTPENRQSLLKEIERLKIGENVGLVHVSSDWPAYVIGSRKYRILYNVAVQLLKHTKIPDNLARELLELLPDEDATLVSLALTLTGGKALKLLEVAEALSEKQEHAKHHGIKLLGYTLNVLAKGMIYTSHKETLKLADIIRRSPLTDDFAKIAVAYAYNYLVTNGNPLHRPRF